MDGRNGSYGLGWNAKGSSDSLPAASPQESRHNHRRRPCSTALPSDWSLKHPGKVVSKVVTLRTMVDDF